MPRAIEDVAGIGPATAKILQESGILSADDLAARQVEEVAAIKGFSQVRAAQVIAAARELFVLTREDPPSTAVASEQTAEAEKQPAKDQKKKDKDRNKKKKKAKVKDKKSKAAKKEKKKDKEKEKKAGKKSKKKKDKK